MRKEVGARFREFRQFLKLSQKAAAGELKVLQSSISQIESGLIFPGFDILVHLVKQRQLNPAWLVTGQGSMCLQAEDTLSGLRRKRGYNEKYLELLELMEDPEAEQIIFAKLLELKRMVGRNEGPEPP